MRPEEDLTRRYSDEVETEMRTDEMVHEIDRLRASEKQLLKEKDNYRELWRDAESWKNRLMEALNEILWLKPGDDSYYIIAGNALGQSRDRAPAEGENTRPDCEYGDCSSHYGDELAWCAKCKRAKS